MWKNKKSQLVCCGIPNKGDTARLEICFILTTYRPDYSDTAVCRAHDSDDRKYSLEFTNMYELRIGLCRDEIVG